MLLGMAGLEKPVKVPASLLSAASRTVDFEVSGLLLVSMAGPGPQAHPVTTFDRLQRNLAAFAETAMQIRSEL